MKIKSHNLNPLTRDLFTTLKSEFDLKDLTEARQSLSEKLRRVEINLSMIKKEIIAIETDIKEIQSTDDFNYVVVCNSKLDDGFQNFYFKTYDKALAYKKEATLNFVSLSDLKK